MIYSLKSDQSWYEGWWEITEAWNKLFCTVEMREHWYNLLFPYPLHISTAPAFDPMCYICISIKLCVQNSFIVKLNLLNQEVEGRYVRPFQGCSFLNNRNPARSVGATKSPPHPFLPSRNYTQRCCELCSCVENYSCTKHKIRGRLFMAQWQKKMTVSFIKIMSYLGSYLK